MMVGVAFNNEGWAVSWNAPPDYQNQAVGGPWTPAYEQASYLDSWAWTVRGSLHLWGDNFLDTIHEIAGWKKVEIEIVVVDSDDSDTVQAKDMIHFLLQDEFGVIVRKVGLDEVVKYNPSDDVKVWASSAVHLAVHRRSFSKFKVDLAGERRRSQLN